MRFQPFARACYPRDQYFRMCSRKPRRQTGTFYILCLRDFEILGARGFKRDDGERLIFLAAYSASGLFQSVDNGRFSVKSFNWRSVAALVGLMRIGKVGV